MILFLFLSALSFQFAESAHSSAKSEIRKPEMNLEMIRKEIGAVEQDLLQAKSSQTTAATQLKKIHRLLALQQKEILLSKEKIRQLGASMGDLSVQKQTLLDRIESQKKGIKRKLQELNRFTQKESLDAHWIKNLDAENQKTYFLTKTVKKELTAVAQLKKDVDAALALELKILEEKNQLDYYVEELRHQSETLGMSEQIQKEILKTNRVSRLEALKRIRNLKDSEQELEAMISSFRTESVATEYSFASQKGKLPLPVNGPVLSAFGKSFNSKTNLLTFQKGITVKTTPTTEVKAVAKGKVAYTGALKNYGNIVILEHPGQYYTLYGQLGDIAVRNGAIVEQGMQVGRSSGEPLYFEIRNKNIAINPMQWLLSRN